MGERQLETSLKWGVTITGWPCSRRKKRERKKKHTKKLISSPTNRAKYLFLCSVSSLEASYAREVERFGKSGLRAILCLMLPLPISPPPQPPTQAPPPPPSNKRTA